MIKKTSSIFLIIIFSFCLLTGCESKSNKQKSSDFNNRVKSVEDISSKKGELVCSRNATVEGGEGKFYYLIKYKGENITSIYSEESITSDDESILKEYSDAYVSIDSNYKGIKNYFTEVKKENDTVIHIINIDYKKVNVKDIIEVEGEEDNIFEDNKPKLSKYLSLIKKMGITCSESTN